MLVHSNAVSKEARKYTKIQKLIWFIEINTITDSMSAKR